MSDVFWYILACYIVFGGICTFSSYRMLTEEQKENSKELLDNPTLKWIVLIMCSFIYPVFVIFVAVRLFVFFVWDKVHALFKRKWGGSVMP